MLTDMDSHISIFTIDYERECISANFARGGKPLIWNATVVESPDYR